MNKTEKAISTFLNMEDLAAKRTVIHAYSPTLKIIMTLCFVVCVISTGRYSLSSLSIYFFYPAIMMALGEIPLLPILGRIVPALPFVLFAGISNMIFERQTALTILGVGISAGFLSCLVMVVKTLLCVSVVLLLAATTSSSKLFAALRRLGMPQILITTLMLCMRYLFVLLTQVRKMSAAYHLRSKKQKGIALAHMGSFTGQLLLSSFDRADRVYSAMKCRGYGAGGYRCSAEKVRTGSIAICVIICTTIILARIFPLEYLLGLLKI